MSKFRFNGVYLSLWLAFVLYKFADLPAIRDHYKRRNPDLDELMADIRDAAEMFATSLNGSEQHKSAEAQPELNQWITPRQASTQLHITAHAVRLAIREKRLPAQ